MVELAALTLRRVRTVLPVHEWDEATRPVEHECAHGRDVLVVAA